MAGGEEVEAEPPAPPQLSLSWSPVADLHLPCPQSLAQAEAPQSGRLTCRSPSPTVKAVGQGASAWALPPLPAPTRAPCVGHGSPRGEAAVTSHPRGSPLDNTLSCHFPSLSGTSWGHLLTDGVRSHPRSKACP